VTTLSSGAQATSNLTKIFLVFRHSDTGMSIAHTG
jgi:hypothetical protein